MKEDVCSSILLDLNTSGNAFGDAERPLFRDIFCVMICGCFM